MQKTDFIVGYHGTTRARADEIDRSEFRSSQRAGLWLGYGRYFFQDAPLHALRWARYMARTETGDAANAAVLYARIDLRECIDLTDRTYWPAIRAIWKAEVQGSGLAQLGLDEVFRRMEMTPIQLNAMSDEEKNRIGMHYVDCQVMNIFVQRLKEKVRSTLDYTTVRAAFVEGAPIYEGSWLWDRSAVIVSVMEPRALGPLARLSDDEMVNLSALAM